MCVKYGQAGIGVRKLSKACNVVAGGGYEHYKTKLHVQWIKQDSDMSLPEVVETAGINEPGKNPLYAFGLPECIGGRDCGEVEIDAKHTCVMDHTGAGFV
jgi:hypothetical protein